MDPPIENNDGGKYPNCRGEAGVLQTAGCKDWHLAAAGLLRPASAVWCTMDSGQNIGMAIDAYLKYKDY